ncbi:hypothetical protein [Sanguibacter sp. Leaf3]|uniref:hypothetical protein n=1 Tax=Sanguibacter sp. Leaf3 TaxID=1736209 RepID=UPI0012E3B8A2|nr:hypothetical protein [Sanguibacter sp. Leaf3]
MDLAVMYKEARKNGWSSSIGTLAELSWMTRAQGWTAIKQRSDDTTPETVLRPLSAEDAHPASMSATYGLGAQPLHTDGAHTPEPPDLIVLMGEAPSSTPTYLFKDVTYDTTPKGIYSGVFRVDAGKDTFLTTALSRGRMRYDPGCMTPLDARAREVSRYFEEQLANAHPFSWDTENLVLLIDNKRALHARGSVAAGDEGRSLTRLAYRVEKTS